MTSNQSILLLTACGLFSGVGLAFKVAKTAGGDSAGWGLGVGAGMGGGAIVTAVLAFFLGLLVRFPDATGHPGLIQGLVMLVGGFLIGGFSGVLGGIIGGVVGQRAQK